VFRLPFPFPAASRVACRTAAALTSLVAGLAVAAVSAAPARAATAQPTCSQGALSQPFLPWGDANSYSLIPGADFEGSPSGWTLSGGAKKVAGSEPYKATGTLGASSLSLPTGASAQSPFVCVNFAYPSFRFFARNEGLLSSVLVQAVYKTPLGNLTASLGAVALSATWQPTLPMLTNSIVGGVLSGGTGQVAIRLTAVTGPSRIDDLFLDPRMR